MLKKDKIARLINKTPKNPNNTQNNETEYEPPITSDLVYEEEKKKEDYTNRIRGTGMSIFNNIKENRLSIMGIIFSVTIVSMIVLIRLRKSRHNKEEEKIKLWLIEAKKKGYNKEMIRNILLKNKFTEEQVKFVLIKF